MSRFLNTRKQLAITTFVESLDCRLKEGLNGTRDYKALAGAIMIAFPLLNASVLITVEIMTLISFPVVFLLMLSYTMPFKSTAANMSLSYCFILKA